MISFPLWLRLWVVLHKTQTLQSTLLVKLLDRKLPFLTLPFLPATFFIVSPLPFGVAMLFRGCTTIQLSLLPLMAWFNAPLSFLYICIIICVYMELSCSVKKSAKNKNSPCWNICAFNYDHLSNWWNFLLIQWKFLNLWYCINSN